MWGFAGATEAYWLGLRDTRCASDPTAEWTTVSCPGQPSSCSQPGTRSSPSTGRAVSITHPLIIWETKMRFSFQSSQGFLVNESDFHEGQGVTGQGALADSNACFSHLEDGAL